MTARTTARKAAPKKAAPKKAAAPKATAQPEGRFARLRREAMEKRAADGALEREPVEPYVIDDVVPPIVIAAPSTNEQFITLLELVESDGGPQVRHVRAMLAAFCGPQMWPRVWNEILKDGDEYDFAAFLDDLLNHFEGALGYGSQELPGK